MTEINLNSNEFVIRLKGDPVAVMLQESPPVLELINPHPVNTETGQHDSATKIPYEIIKLILDNQKSINHGKPAE